MDLLRIALSPEKAPVPYQSTSDPSSVEEAARSLLSLSEDLPHRDLLEAIARSHILPPLTDGAADPNAPTNDGSASYYAQELTFGEALGAAPQVSDVVRIAIRAVQIGRVFTHLDRQELYHALKRFRDRGSGASSLILISLNTIAHAFREKSIPLGFKLCQLGLTLSCKLDDLSALRLYIFDCCTNNYRLARGVWSNVLDHLGGHAASGSRFGAWRRRDSLHLLTGSRSAWPRTWSGETGKRMSIQDCSIINCLQLNDRRDLIPCLDALARLGGCQALWELRGHVLQNFKPSAEFPASKMHKAFIKAMIRANDPVRAMWAIISSQIPADNIAIDDLRVLCHSYQRLGFGSASSVLLELVKRGWAGDMLSRLRDAHDPALLVEHLEVALGVHSPAPSRTTTKYPLERKKRKT